MHIEPRLTYPRFHYLPVAIANLVGTRPTLVLAGVNLVGMRSTLAPERTSLVEMQSTLVLARSTLVGMQSTLAPERISLVEMQSTLVLARPTLAGMRFTLVPVRISLVGTQSTLVLARPSLASAPHSQCTTIFSENIVSKCKRAHGSRAPTARKTPVSIGVHGSRARGRSRQASTSAIKSRRRSGPCCRLRLGTGMGVPPGQARMF